MGHQRQLVLAGTDLRANMKVCKFTWNSLTKVQLHVYSYIATYMAATHRTLGRLGEGGTRSLFLLLRSKGVLS